MAFNRVPTTSVPIANYVDGQIIYGADVNTIISVFKAAVNANGGDLSTMLSGDRDANVVTTAATLTTIESPEDGDLAFVLNDETQDNLTALYSYNNATEEWDFVYTLSVADLKSKVEALVANTAGRSAEYAENTGVVDAEGNVTNGSTAEEIRDGIDDATAALANTITNDNRLNKIEPKFDETTLNNNIELFNQAVKTDSAVQFKSLAIVDPADTENPSVTITKAKLANLDDTYKKQAADDRFINKNARGSINGVASLDETGRLPIEQLPIDTVVFRGQFGEGEGDLPDGSELQPVETGDFYICVSNGYESAVAGLTFDTGDKAVYDGEDWSKIDNTETVTGVRGEEEPEGQFRIGNITITRENLGLENVANIAQVTSVSGTSPIVSTGGTTPSISITAATTQAAGSMSSADKAKLDGIAASANNYVHPNHTGDVTSIADGDTTIVNKAVTLSKMADLTAGRIIGNNEEVDGVPKALTASEVRALIDVYDTESVDTALGLKLDADARGAVNGVASLVEGKVPVNQLPSFVDDVIEYADLSALNANANGLGESTGKIYVTLDTNKTYRWGGSAYAEISPSEVISVNSKTGAVTLAGSDIDIDAEDVDIDASGFTGILTTDNTDLQTALATIDGHEHTEADITDLDKYTKQEVDTKLAGKVNVRDLNAGLTLYPTITVESGGTFDGYSQLVSSISDSRFTSIPEAGAVVYTTNNGTVGGTSLITSTDPDTPNVVGQLVSDAGLIIGDVAGINLTTIGQVIKATGNANENARLRFRVYKSSDLVNPIVTSGYTDEITSEDFIEIFQSGTLISATFQATDRVVIIYEGYTTGGSPIYGIKFGGIDPVRTLVPIPLAVIQNAQSISYDPSSATLTSTNLQDAVDELDTLIQQNTSVLKIQRFVITNADNGDGTFSYTWNGNARTGTLATGQYRFDLEDDVEYIVGQNRLEIKVNNNLSFYPNDTEIEEIDTETVGITYALQNSDEVFIKVYQGLDSVALVVPDGAVTTAKLSTALQNKVTSYDNHIASTANPHGVTAAQLSLEQLTNHKQVKAAASSTDGQIPIWSGNAGDAIVDGYSVQTSLSSSTSALVRADAVVTALSGKQDTLVSATNIKTINGTSLLGSGDYEIDIPAVAVQATAPDIQTANVGDLWFNSSNTILYIAYDDGSSKQWVQVGFAELQNELAALIGAAPDALNTLEELAEALNDNPDVIDDLIQLIGQKADQSTVTTLTTTVGTKADKNATIENISADYTLLLTDNGKVKETSNTNPLTITIPTNTTVAFPVGTQIAFLRNAEGTVTFAPEDAQVVTINSKDSALAIAGQYASAALLKTATDTWQLIGSLE